MIVLKIIVLKVKKSLLCPPDRLKEPSMSTCFENKVAYKVIKTQHFIFCLIIAKDFTQNPLPQ
jgi:hypothetical protein